MAISSQTANYTSYKYIVTSTEPGPFHTIQSCLDYVQALGETTTILVRPGTYIEDLTLYSGINITGASEGQVIVLGEHTPPAAGTLVLTNLTLQSATSVLVSAAAGTTDITFQDCTFGTSVFVVDCLNWTGSLHFDNCLEQSASNGIVNNTGGSAVEILNSSIGAGINSMVASGVTRIFGSRIYAPITLSGASSIDTSYIEGALVIIGTNDSTLTSSKINSGADTAITATTTGLIRIENCVIHTTGLTAIDGTSSVELTSCSFGDTDTIAGTIVLSLASEFKSTRGKVVSYLELEDAAFRCNSTDPDDGMVLIGNTATNKPVWATLSVSGVLTKSEGEGTLGLTVPAGGLPFTVATADLTATPNTCYSIQHGTPATELVVTLPDPVDSTAGDQIKIMGYTSGGWKVAQSAAGHQIILGNQSSTLGAAGYIEFTNQYDVILLTCIDGNVWQADAPQGNITIA
jgi:hypothetical protein